MQIEKKDQLLLFTTNSIVLFIKTVGLTCLFYFWEFIRWAIDDYNWIRVFLFCDEININGPESH